MQSNKMQTSMAQLRRIVTRLHKTSCIIHFWSITDHLRGGNILFTMAPKSEAEFMDKKLHACEDIVFDKNASKVSLKS